MEIIEPENKKKEVKPKSIVFGLVVLLFGLLLLLRNTGFLDETTRNIFFSWEMLLIAIGLINLFDRNRPLGVILIALGVVFLLPDIFDVPYSLHKIFWPALIIVVGLFIMFSSGKRCMRRKYERSGTTEDLLDEVAAFSGVERNIASPEFKGGKIVTVFGGAKLNLMNAVLAPGVNELEIVCLFGGTTLIVPADWNIKVEVVHVFGGFADHRNQFPVDFNKTLIIKGVTIFGGGEVKSF